MKRGISIATLLMSFGGCVWMAHAASQIRNPSMDDTIRATVYADTWFEMYVNGDLVALDSIRFI